MSSDILLQARGLARRYGDREALHGLDLTLSRGQVLGLLGPNGAGKSTTLRILSGTLPPSAGEVKVCGLDLLAHPVAAKRYLGFLPERPPVYPDMRVGDYLRYCGRLHALKGGELAAAVDAALMRCALAAVAKRLIGNLSKGYQQRVGIAQAILHNPSVLILDEPTVGLDPLQVRAIRELIQGLRADHAIVFSSHILPEIQALCDAVTILNRGRPVYHGALNQEPGGLEVLLGCRQAVDLPLLGALPGVAEVARLSSRRWRLTLTEAAAAEQVQRAVIDAGWGLQEWMPSGGSLEQLFVSLTHGEAAAERALA